MIAETLIPRGTLKNPLTVHVDPCFLETLYSASGEINTAVIKVITNGNLQIVRNERFVSCFCAYIQRRYNFSSRRLVRHTQTCRLLEGLSCFAVKKQGNSRCKAVALFIYNMSPGSQSLMTSLGIVSPAACNCGSTSRQKCGGLGVHPVQP